MPRILSRNVRVLGWTSFLNDVASEMTFPLLPRFLTEVLGGSAVGLGAIEGLADSTASLLKLASGGWSDRIGSRKGFVLSGYALTALIRPLAGLATMPWHLLATRLCDRVGKGIRTTPRDTLVAESTDRRHLGWAFGFQRAMDHFGAAVGPLAASGFLLLAGPSGEALRWLFVLTLIPGLAVLVLLWFGLEEKPQTAKAARPFTLSLRPFDANFRVYLLAMFVFTLGNSSDAFLLVRAGALGVSEIALPMLWLALHVVKSLGSLATGATVNRVGARRMIFLGWTIYAAVYMGFGLATKTWHAWALFLVYGMYYALTEPIEKKLVADLVPSENKGLAYGWYNFAIGMSALPASLLFGWLYEEFGAMVAFGVGAALAGLAALLLAMVRVERHPSEE
ncbi:MAG TPA: MFS transporter [Pirellulales bacterium]|jgi:MFS family permease|nr:MFS transporter [Pirellulales bacterium]